MINIDQRIQRLSFDFGYSLNGFRIFVTKLFEITGPIYEINTFLSCLGRIFGYQLS